MQPSLAVKTGRIEVMQIEGFSGGDLSGRASQPNLGWISVRYPVTDLQGYRTELESKGLAIAYEGEAVILPGIGTTDLSAVRDPGGNITEFYSAD